MSIVFKRVVPHEVPENTISFMFRYKTSVNPHLVFRSFSDPAGNVTSEYAIFKHCCACNLEIYTDDDWAKQSTPESMSFVRLMASVDTHCDDCASKLDKLAERIYGYGLSAIHELRKAPTTDLSPALLGSKDFV